MSFPPPRYIQLYPTFRCNQNCLFCSNEHLKTGDLALEKALELLDILFAGGVMEIDIAGGEPLLLDWMPEFTARANARGFEINLSTNGSRPGILERFSGADKNLLKIGVSIEGGSAGTHNRITQSGNFNAAVESIKILQAMGLEPIVKTVVNRHTMPDIPNIANMLREIGVERYYLIHMDVMSADAAAGGDYIGYNDFIRFFKETKKIDHRPEILKVHASCFSRASIPEYARCAGGVLKLSVLPDGSVFPCSLFNGNEEFRLGNIFQDGLASILTNPRLASFRNFRQNQCRVKGCENRQQCTGGCPAHGLCHYGNPDAVDIRCVTG